MRGARHPHRRRPTSLAERPVLERGQLVPLQVQDDSAAREPLVRTVGLAGTAGRTGSAPLPAGTISVITVPCGVH
jgi:hypothetical protein